MCLLREIETKLLSKIASIASTVSMCSKMAESSVVLSQDRLSCSICLNLLKDPVAIPCGHSYCMNCITDCWDQDDQKRVYSCPQCRQTFSPRPVLGKNTILAEVVERFKKTKLQAASADQRCSGSGDVECDVCTGDENKAIKSCLVCLESYCQTHFERHEEFHSRNQHKVIDATRRLQEMICPQHEKLLEIFCRTEQCCICYLCTIDEHKEHEIVSAAAERTEKQRQLEETQRTLRQKILNKKRDNQKLKRSVMYDKRLAQRTVEDSERIFTELIHFIEKSRSEVTKMIRDQEKAAVSQSKGRLEQLEQEIDDLLRRDAELLELSHTDHHIHFLQSFQSLSVPPGSTDSPSITVSSRLSFDDVIKFVSHLREKLDQFCREELKILSGGDRNLISTPETNTREEFLRYYSQFTLDRNTANKYLALSEGNRVIKSRKKARPYPDHPDRFDSSIQVLCREDVCGRCYWEVEWSGKVCISVSYESISRKGGDDECGFGANDQSWSLFCSDSSCSFWHNNKHTELPVVSNSSRIGVYVDHSAGTLSFYSVSDTMTLIHRFFTTFTQPLYPGFWIDRNYQGKLRHACSKVTLCDLKI